ncbi:T6SS immunity protein Tli4 family protein [Massilia aerilata]|uniref:T6SS immunity protein Tli4 family protein n=1 Tax=Massilia aerilata TaxID=453817 RepID=A0ABW0S5J5_9BURK
MYRRLEKLEPHHWYEHRADGHTLWLSDRNTLAQPTDPTGSLIPRPDGTHDFEWAFVGTPRDVANPSDFHAAMFIKVTDNMVGAAKKTSVSDDEAVAFWDELSRG